jgi:hypothetical protein
VARFLVFGNRDPPSWDVDDANMAPPFLTLVALIHTTCHGACGEFAPNKSAVHCGHCEGDKFATWYLWARTSPDKDPDIRERCLMFLVTHTRLCACKHISAKALSRSRLVSVPGDGHPWHTRICNWCPCRMASTQVKLTDNDSLGCRFHCDSTMVGCVAAVL